MQRPIFLVVTDAHFYPGALATVASIANYHPEAEIVIVDNCIRKMGLTAAQRASLEPMTTRILSGHEFTHEARKAGAWELKAYAAETLSLETDVLIGVDADCVLCGPIHDVIHDCFTSGNFFGGKDGGGPRFGNEYSVYGFPTPSWSDQYMSTSLYLCRNSDLTKKILGEWAACCSRSVFGGTGPYPGHGDQGVLNALLYKYRPEAKITLLDNDLWSQHWVYWDRPLELHQGKLYNPTKQASQRSLHAVGAGKPWTRSYRESLEKIPAVKLNYAWFLACLELGLSRSRISPQRVLEEGSSHIVDDLQEMRHLLETLDTRAAPYSGPAPRQSPRRFRPSLTAQARNSQAASSICDQGLL